MLTEREMAKILKSLSDKFLVRRRIRRLQEMRRDQRRSIVRSGSLVVESHEAVTLYRKVGITIQVRVCQIIFAWTYEN